MTDKEIDSDGTDLPVCPWCGCRHHNYFEFHEGNTYTCDECGKQFEVTATDTTTLFTTEKRGN